MKLLDYTALELGAAIKRGEVRVVDAVRASLAQIKLLQQDVNAFITVTGDQALRRAEIVQQGIDEGRFTHPLAGVPMAIKDNISTKGLLTTCASKMLSGYEPIFDATVVKQLYDIGAVCMGKTNMDEFAMGSSTETSYYKQTKNPWDFARVPGGSSGGSAAAVASRQVWYALGSDTGGSIRQPASFCGVTGIKPTYGAVSRYGLLAYASSLDQIGPICRDAADARAVLEVIMGKDALDTTSVPCPSPTISAGERLDGLRVGIPSGYMGEGLSPQVKGKIMACAKHLESLGATVEQFELPTVEYAIPAYYILACAEASSNLSRYDGVKYGFSADDYTDLASLYTKSRSQGFGREVKSRIMLGAFVLSSGYYDAYYNKALRVKALIKAAFDNAFERFDLMLTPTAPTCAFRVGENMDDPLKMYLGDIYTVSVNMAGLPAISIPCGLTDDGMPVGAQLIGAAFSESTLLTASHAYQNTSDYHKLCPPSAKGAM